METENVYSFCGNDSITIVDVYGRVGINTKLLSYYMSRLGNGRVINGIIDILSSDSEGYYSFTDSEDELKSDFVAIAKSAVIHDAVDITIDEFNVWTTRSFSTTKSWQISEKFRVTLNSSSRVELSGTYKVKQCEDGRRFVKDATCDIVWYDEMDANSFRELYYKEVIGGGGWEKVSSSRAIILITEGLVDLVGDKTLGADFKFKISKSVRYGGCCEE